MSVSLLAHVAHFLSSLATSYLPLKVVYTKKAMGAPFESELVPEFVLTDLSLV